MGDFVEMTGRVLKVDEYGRFLFEIGEMLSKNEDGTRRIFDFDFTKDVDEYNTYYKTWIKVNAKYSKFIIGECVNHIRNGTIVKVICKRAAYKFYDDRAKKFGFSLVLIEIIDKK